MLQEFLNKKPLYYDKIDYERMPKTYARIKDKLKLPKIIHLVGTNGKGTTGRFLASALYSLGFNVGHYTSPHILHFNERIWLNGNDVLDCTLENAHTFLQEILTQEESEALSYFEYTTLLAMVILQHFDYVVLEAGLGGEKDATAVFENIVTVVTPIDKDHEAFLGDTIEQIATTKLKAVQKEAILAYQKHQEVYEVAKKITPKYTSFEEFLEEEDKQKIQNIAKSLNLPQYLEQNLSLSVAVLKFLKLSYSESDFVEAKLFGRLTQLKENVIVDVGHNPLAAQAIVESLKPNKYTLVYNSYSDKDYKSILTILQPIVQEVEILHIENERIEDTLKLEHAVDTLGFQRSVFKELKEEKNYLVFGSFKVVEEFLKVING